MLRKLIIMRHAKSDWNTSAGSDHARPLNARGRRDAPRIAREVVARGWEPTHVVSSDSQRTRETYERMAAEFLETPNLAYFDSLYHAGIRQLETVMALLPDDAETVLALGHNPGWQAAVFALTGHSELMTTANAALISLDAESWADAIVREGRWTLHEVLRPKELP